MSSKRWLFLSTLAALALFCSPVNAQPTPTRSNAQTSPQPDALFQTVQALDTKLFDAYNQCDLATLNAMISDDLEFYHDKTGLSVGKASFIAAIKQNICGKVHRTLVPGSLEVYPLKGYGAVEIGVHRFTHPGHPQDGIGEAKFITLWHYKDGAWKVSRAISYDHGPAPEAASVPTQN